MRQKTDGAGSEAGVPAPRNQKCEGCGEAITAGRLYLTDDDVELCFACYSAVPVVRVADERKLFTVIQSKEQSHDTEATQGGSEGSAVEYVEKQRHGRSSQHSDPDHELTGSQRRIVGVPAPQAQPEKIIEIGETITVSGSIPIDVKDWRADRVCGQCGVNVDKYLEFLNWHQRKMPHGWKSFSAAVRDATGLAASERNRWESHDDKRTFEHWEHVVIQLNALWLCLETGVTGGDPAPPSPQKLDDPVCQCGHYQSVHFQTLKIRGCSGWMPGGVAHTSDTCPCGGFTSRAASSPSTPPTQE